MKKFIFGLMVAVGFASLSGASSTNRDLPPMMSRYGGYMKAGSFVAFGSNPAEPSCSGFIGTAAMNITAGDPVILAGTTYPFSVSRTATAGNSLFVGIAITSATTGNAVEVCTRGIARVSVAQDVTVGGLYITSATAGKMTAVAAVAEGSFTTLSKTAIAVRSIETKTYSASTPTFLGQILGY